MMHSSATPVHEDEAHDQEHGAPRHERESRSAWRPMAIALVITTTFLVIEVIGGLLTNSLALLADAGHMATDAAALGLSLFAIWLAGKPATPKRSFGFYRAEILAALINAAALVAISIYIFWEAFQRLGSPPDVDSGPMLVVAVAGLAANAASAWVLTRGGGHEQSLNVRGALLHVIGDMLGSVGAIVAAVVMLLTGWYLADPLLSAGIGVLILWNSWRLLREAVDVLLEATPAGIDARDVSAAVTDVAGVSGIHDLHIWTVTSGFLAMSGHVEVTDERGWTEILTELTRLLRERFGIAHVTLQPEPARAKRAESLGCSFDSPEGQAICLGANGHPVGRVSQPHHDH